MEGAENLYIYIYMKPTDRIFQQTNDTIDDSFFDEYIDMKLLILLIFILHRIKYTIENVENHIYIYIYIYTDPTDRIVQRYIFIIYKLKISTISYIYIYTRNQLFATQLKQIEYSHRGTRFHPQIFRSLNTG